MHHSSHRDPLDGPPPKWKKRDSISPQVQDSAWSWDHTGIKPPSDKALKQTPSQSPSKTPTHGSVSSVVREKVTEHTLPQSPISSAQGVSNVDRSAITANEEFIANQLLVRSDMDELFSACSDQSGEQFLSLCIPLIKRLGEFIQDKTINPEHVLFLLRKTLKITIP